jgi:hypothetical protein
VVVEASGWNDWNISLQTLSKDIREGLTTPPKHAV